MLTRGSRHEWLWRPYLPESPLQSHAASQIRPMDVNAGFCSGITSGKVTATVAEFPRFQVSEPAGVRVGRVAPGESQC